MVRTIRSLLAAAGTAAVLAACTSAPEPQPAATTSGSPTASPDRALDRYYSQELDWQDCGQQLQCADLTVPRDYGNPGDGDVQIKVARYRSGGGTKKSLVFNPGGPGGSGIEFAKAAPYVVSPEVLEAYDFVGFDPRGVGQSSPIDCLTDRQTDEVIATDPNPATDEQIAQFAEDAALIAEGCQKRSGDILEFVDSGSVVKDMDILRAALGEDKLDYMGKSYGTKLGALYAEDFPERTGRVVLDGVLPPDLGVEQISRGQAEGFEDSLRRYVQWCQEVSNCPLQATDVDGGVAEIQKFLTDLESDPIPAGDRPLTEGLGMQAILYYLYFPYAGDWDKLNRGLADAFDGDGATLLAMLDERLERDSTGAYKNKGNSYDAFIAISCLDDQGDASADELRKRADEWSQAAPTFGSALSWSEYVCTEWPVPAKGEPRKVSAAGVGPILVVSTTHDPATPVEWAEQLSSELADAHLIVLDTDGHTAYFNGSDCIDRAVDAYLLDGSVPAEGTRCDDARPY